MGRSLLSVCRLLQEGEHETAMRTARESGCGEQSRVNLGEHIVYVIDDDPALREALENLLASHRFDVKTFASPETYMAEAKRDIPGCLILDLQLPDINGLELQDRLGTETHPPIVFITGHGTISSSVRAMKAGAVDFLPKPFDEEAIIHAVETAIMRDREARRERAERVRLRERYRSLTPRERDVLPLIVEGLLNKQAAAKLGISIVTLQIHRSNVMRKMGAASFAELVRMAANLGIGPD
jgi:FixJ family two-component response regulator